MKVVAINGSPRKDGNTNAALEIMAAELLKENIETEIIQVGTEPIRGCISCGGCYRHMERLCVFGDDIVHEVTEKIRQADGFILASPTYFGGIAGSMKALCDRVFYCSYSTGAFRGKVGAAVATLRRSGGVEVYNQLNNYINLVEAVSPPSQYWVVTHSKPRSMESVDEEGEQIVRRNAQAMAWLLKIIDATKDEISLPPLEKKVATNFMR